MATIPRKLVKLSPAMFKRAMDELYGIGNYDISHWGEVTLKPDNTFIGFWQGSKLDAYLREHFYKTMVLDHHYNETKHRRLNDIVNKLTIAGYNVKIISDESTPHYHFYMITIYHEDDNVTFVSSSINKFLQRLLIVEKLCTAYSFNEIKDYLINIQYNFWYDRCSYIELISNDKFKYDVYFKVR